MPVGKPGVTEALPGVKQMDKKTIAGQIDFLVEADKLKTVIRNTLLTNRSRLENSAEHSWHVALTA
jgi:putative hydrolase of HD superfamily